MLHVLLSVALAASAPATDNSLKSLNETAAQLNPHLPENEKIIVPRPRQQAVLCKT